MGLPSLVLWLSIVNLNDKQLAYLPEGSYDELILATRTAFPQHTGATFSFHVDGKRVTPDEVRALANETAVVATPDYAHHEFTVLSNKPRIFYFPHFLTDEEADGLIELGEGFLKNSQVGDGSANGNEDTSIRSSQVYFLAHEQEDHWVPRSIKRKVHGHTKLSYEHMEALQLQKYRAPRGAKKDYYVPHLDSIYGQDRRIATMIFYLADTPEGGETVFPLVRPNVTGRPGFDLDPHEAMSNSARIFQQACAAKGTEEMDVPIIKVKAKKGAAVLFYTLQPGMQLDSLAVHGSCPVTQGTKWISQQWIRESWQEPLYSAHLEAFYTFEEVDEDGRMADTTSMKSAAQRHHLLPTGKQTVAASDAPAHVVKMGDARKWCSRHDTKLLMPMSRSHAMTVAFWALLDGDTSKAPAEVTIATSDGALRWVIKLWSEADADYASLSGPTEGTPELKMELVQGQWNQVVFAIENEQPGEVDMAQTQRSWSFGNCLVQSVPSRFDGAVDADCNEAQTVDVSSTRWHEAQLCTSMPKGTMFSDMFIFSRQLEPSELSHLGNTIFANKPIREEVKSQAKWRKGVGPY